jgi:hypothetical protein
MDVAQTGLVVLPAPVQPPARLGAGPNHGRMDALRLPSSHGLLSPRRGSLVGAAQTIWCKPPHEARQANRYVLADTSLSYSGAPRQHAGLGDAPEARLGEAERRRGLHPPGARCCPHSFRQVVHARGRKPLTVAT